MNFYDSLARKFYPDRAELARELDGIRENKRIVFTNGCFDLLHPGHVSYLARARDLAGEDGVLVLALNSDASVHRLKGDGRPVNSVENRAAVLAGLACIDYVTVFAEDTPEETLAALKPHVHTKGGDYKAEELPEKKVIDAYGGEIAILPFLPGHSTTAILKKRG